MTEDDRPKPEAMREDGASRSAVREFLDGPSLRDAMALAVELAGTSEWFARPIAADAGRGHGIDATDWMRARFGLANP